MNDRQKVLEVIEKLGIQFQIYEHPALPTIDEAVKYWNNIGASHCKNLFFRNHKGNKHYLVILEHKQALDIHDLEKRLKQGKISFASDHRLYQFLGLKAGSVSPFGLINDSGHHVELFIDANLKHSELISFHPNENTATIVLRMSDFEKFLNWTGNDYQYLKLYD
jgi:Ala-tRNA(Pro) deacylase